MMIKHQIKSSHIFQSFAIIALGLSLALRSQPALGAEKVKLIYGPFNGRISVASLEKYATTGEMTREFRLYSKFVDRETLAQLRYWLGNRFESDRVEMYRFSKTPEGEKFFQDLGTVIKTHPQRNGFYAIRSALIGAADKPNNSDGWTIIEAMHNFPTEDLQINTKDLFKLQKFWSDNQSDYQAALKIFRYKENN
ncbi:alpha/beta hydrolase [Pleurocapsales cyanobacterium LEGE 10410]|nr:alpha/beta hydrolase [Pleurocapsales cyanobacterium LEGE 10410]